MAKPLSSRGARSASQGSHGAVKPTFIEWTSRQTAVVRGRRRASDAIERVMRGDSSSSFGFQKSQARAFCCRALPMCRVVRSPSPLTGIPADTSGMGSIACVLMCGLRSVAFVVAVASATSAAAAQGAAERGLQIAQERCTVCRAMDLIAQQRLTRPAWDREVAKMVGWGAMLDPSQANELAAYLAARFGPYRVTAPAPLSDDTAALVKSRCTI